MYTHGQNLNQCVADGTYAVQLGIHCVFWKVCAREMTRASAEVLKCNYGSPGRFGYLVFVHQAQPHTHAGHKTAR